MLTQAPVLASSGILKTSNLETDVSGTGLEVVLAGKKYYAELEAPPIPDLN